MAKKTQIELAIEKLQARRDEIAAKAQADCEAIVAAIDVLRMQQKPKKAAKPRTKASVVVAQLAER